MLASMGLDIEKMKELRERLGISQSEAARRSGMPAQQAWHRIESGTHTNISIETLERIAAALGVDARDLLTKPQKK